MELGLKLKSEEIAHYKNEGFLIPEYKLPDEMVNRMRDSLLQLIDANSHLESDVMYGPHISFNPGQKMRGDPVWLNYASHPPILDILEQLIGPDFLLWGTTVFGKPANGGKRVPWHQDGEYWPIEPLSNASVWIALDDCTPDNGCLQIIRGSHKERRLFNHYNDDSDSLLIHEVADECEYDTSKACDISLKSGEFVIFDVFSIHGSHPNNSHKRRAGFVLRIMPTTSFFNHKRQDVALKTPILDWANRPLFLLRGRDICARNNFLLGH